MPLRLPPLTALRLFEAAGRLLSFKMAAEELHLTPSAVSHGIQSLEDWLGTPLFHRGARGLALTPAGEAYQPKVAEALAMLASASEAVAGRKATGQLKLSAAPTFASRWLLPRLPAFAAQYPNIRLTLDTSRRLVEFPRDGFDLAIRLGSQPTGVGFALRLFHEELVPVCSPKLLQELGTATFGEVLARAALIHVTTPSEDWAYWFHAAGIDPLPVGNGLAVDTVQLAIEGAVLGLGVALGRRPLVDLELDVGTLVRLGGAVQSSTSYWLVGPDEPFERPEARQFRSWIIRELAEPARAGQSAHE